MFVLESGEVGSSRQQDDTTDDPTNIWKRPVKVDIEKTRYSCSFVLFFFGYIVDYYYK